MKDAFQCERLGLHFVNADYFDNAKSHPTEYPIVLAIAFEILSKKYPDFKKYQEFYECLLENPTIECADNIIHSLPGGHEPFRFQG